MSAITVADMATPERGAGSPSRARGRVTVGLPARSPSVARRILAIPKPRGVTPRMAGARSATTSRETVKVMATTQDDTPVVPLRVMVVDDHQTFADLLSLALSSEPDLECVGTAGSAAEAVAMAAELRPNIVVMDIEMPRQDGLAATRRLREVVPDLVIIVVTAHRDPQWVLRATQAGASAFVPKNGSLPEMLDVLRRARNGGMLVAASAFGSTSAAPERTVAAPRVELTQRERDVLHCLNRGMAPKAIARVLGISLHTCRGYVKSLLSKLGVSSQLEAVVTTQRLGLIDRSDGG